MDNNSYSASSIQQVPAYNNSESLRLRLETETILREIEAHLKGQVIREQYNKETQQYETIAHDVSDPLANPEGQHRLLMWLRSKVNHAVVQGNFSKDEFQEHIGEMMSNLNFVVHLNSQRWGIEDNNIRYVILDLINIVEEFLSRTVDNQERKLFSWGSESKRETVPHKKFTVGGA